MKKLIVILALFMATACQGAYQQVPAAAGTVISFAGSTCPSHSIAADGTSLLRAGQYAALFSAISTTWGSADGTHFNAPNLAGRFLRGTGSITDGNGGTAVTLGSFQDHTTAVNGLHDTGHTHNQWGLATVPNLTPGATLPTYDGVTGVNSAATSSSTANLSGDSETRPKSYGVKFCIYY